MLAKLAVIAGGSMLAVITLANTPAMPHPVLLVAVGAVLVLLYLAYRAGRSLRHRRGRGRRSRRHRSGRIPFLEPRPWRPRRRRSPS